MKLNNDIKGGNKLFGNIYFFFIFEKLPINIWYSNNIKKKNYYNFNNQKINNKLLFYKSNDSFFLNNAIIDASAISFKNIFLKYFKNKNKIIFFILEKNYFLNNYTFNLSYQSVDKGKIKAISNNYLNSSWLEREVSEMYGLFFFNKSDSRKLLLDYTSEINPLKKNSNIGLLDYTFNISKNRLVKTKHNMVEL